MSTRLALTCLLLVLLLKEVRFLVDSYQLRSQSKDEDNRVPSHQQDDCLLKTSDALVAVNASVYRRSLTET
jgi:hypothetical protein